MAKSKTQKKQVSIADVADRLSLSTATVSLAIRHSPRISAATRKRVFETAKEMNYLPNLQARSLRMQQTQCIAAIVPNLMDHIYTEQLDEMQKVAKENGYELAYACTQWDIEEEQRGLNYFLAQQADALIITSISDFEQTEHLAMFAGRNRPLIVADQFPQSLRDIKGISTVAVHRDEGVRKAARLLLDLGHRRFAMVGFGQARTHIERRASATREIKAAGIDPATILDIPVGGDLTQDGYESMLQYLSAHGKEHLPTGMICMNDTIAIGVISALAAFGVRVPEDVSLVGFDNIDMAKYVLPPLTTVNKFVRDLGRKCMDIALEQVSNPAAEERHVVIGTELIVRGSTGPVSDARL